MVALISNSHEAHSDWLTMSQVTLAWPNQLMPKEGYLGEVVTFPGWDQHKEL
jgi:hypothetical protein